MAGCWVCPTSANDKVFGRPGASRGSAAFSGTRRCEVGEFVLDGHPFGVAGGDVSCGGVVVVGDRQGRLVTADVSDGDLAHVVRDLVELDRHIVQVVVAVAAESLHADGCHQLSPEPETVMFASILEWHICPSSDTYSPE